MADLFQRDKPLISRHIKNVFEEGELERTVDVAEFATTAQDAALTTLYLQLGSVFAQRSSTDGARSTVRSLRAAETIVLNPFQAALLHRGRADPP